jgi:adenosylcobinamide-GDP ribazoletransferase
MQKLLAAIKYLTLWGRITRAKPTAEAIGNAAIYFPLIGFTLGLLLALIQYGLGLYLDSSILSVLLVAALVLATGGRHFEGTRNTFAALCAGPASDTRLQDNFWGIVAIVLLILFKSRAIDVINDKLTLSLLLTPVLARWALVLFIYGYHERCEETPRRIAENVRFWHLLLTTVGILGLAFYLLGRKALWIGLALSVVMLLARSFLHRRQAVLTHDNFGAVIELGETLCLILLASL